MFPRPLRPLVSIIGRLCNWCVPCQQIQPEVRNAPHTPPSSVVKMLVADADVSADANRMVCGMTKGSGVDVAVGKLHKQERTCRPH